MPVVLFLSIPIPLIPHIQEFKLLPYIIFGTLRIPMYGLLITLGTGLGILVAAMRAKTRGIARIDVINAAVFGGVGTFVGAKLLYLFTVAGYLSENFDSIMHDPQAMLSLLRQGYVFYGGLIGAIAGVYFYTRRYRLDFVGMLDLLIVSVPLIHAIGRVGCFCAGCCWGRPAAPPWGLLFNASPVAPHDVTLFPVQLLEAALNLALFILLFCYARKKRPPLCVTTLYLCSYGIERFVLEYFRADTVRGSFLWFSTSQWISILLSCAALCAFFLLRKKAQKQRSA